MSARGHQLKAAGAVLAMPAPRSEPLTEKEIADLMRHAEAARRVYRLANQAMHGAGNDAALRDAWRVVRFGLVRVAEAVKAAADVDVQAAQQFRALSEFLAGYAELLEQQRGRAN